MYIKLIVFEIELETRSLCCRPNPWLCRWRAHPAATGKAIIRPHLAATVCIALKSNKNIHFEMILDVGIGEKRKETRFLI